MAPIGNLEETLGIDKTSFDEDIRGAADRLNDMDGAAAKAGSISGFGSKLRSAGGTLTKFVSGLLPSARSRPTW